MTPLNARCFKVSIFILLMTFSGPVENIAQKLPPPVQTLFQICRNSDALVPSSTCGDSESPIPIITDVNCLGTVDLSFHLIDVFEEVPNTETTILLPAEYPSIYFRWNEDSETEITVGPFRELRYVPWNASQVSGHDYYAIDFELSISCGRLCDTDVAYLTLPIEILEWSGLMDVEGEVLGFIDYPIAEYSGQGDIFSCAVFVDTEACCESGGCPNLEYEIDFCIDCQMCNASEESRGDPNTEFFLEESVYPNPFRDEINLSFQANKLQDIQIRIFNINNQETVVAEEFKIKGNGQKRIDTSKLKPGVYIVSINNGIESWSKKIIKLGIGQSRQ